MPYIGNQPAEQFTSFATQEFSTSATTSYTLDHAVTNENEIALFINNVRQQPGSGKAYTATGTALTLSAATASTDTMYCVFLGRALQTVTPATNSISTAMISDNAVTTAKISGSLGKVLQVIHGTDETLRETTSTSFASLTLNASITPSATSSKVFVMVNLNTSTAFVNKHSYFTVFRDSSNLGATDGFVALQDEVSDDTRMAASFSTLDSPSTTSETTYTLYGKCDSSGKARINDNNEGRSTITLMEIGA